MDDFRIIPAEELEREKLFKQALESLEADLKIGKIEYELSIFSHPPLIITNGNNFNGGITRQIFELFHKIFDTYIASLG
jgi:hypothetical protein